MLTKRTLFFFWSRLYQNFPFFSIIFFEWLFLVSFGTFNEITKKLLILAQIWDALQMSSSWIILIQLSLMEMTIKNISGKNSSNIKQQSSQDRHSDCRKQCHRSNLSFKKNSETKIFFKKSRQNYTYISNCLSQTSITSKILSK